MVPRYYQQESNDAAWDYLRNETGSPLIVLPTGAGKSLVIAMLAKQAVAYSARVIVLQHRKELIQQNAEKIELLTGMPVGKYSAGLGEKSTTADIVCAGIQSVYRKANELGRRELVLIDEVHLVSGKDDSMYGQFLADLTTINPAVRLVGLTATPFRTGEGPICGREKLFSRICYESQTGTLIQEGFLCPITNRPATATIDTSKIKTRGTEFISSSAEAVFCDDDNVLEACKEIVEKCFDRHSVLIFSAGVHHAEMIAETIGQLTGETVGIVTGETFPMERVKLLADFKMQGLRWLVNCDVLTTGFDAPCIDAIAVLRATMSPGLFAQIVGRGLRIHESKQECLILDFGENIKRHGSLDDPDYGRASVMARGAGTGEAVEKNGRGKPCLACNMDVAANARICPECGFMFPVKHDTQADQTSTLTGESEPVVYDVQSVSWGKHVKKQNPDEDPKPPTLRVNYVCKPAGEEGNLTEDVVSEWVCIEHEGFAGRKAQAWWDAHSFAGFPESVDSAVSLLDRKACRMPVKITAKKKAKWFEILSVEYADDPPETWGEEPVALDSEEEIPGDYSFVFSDDEPPF